jgi:hypothetical protein
MSLSMFKFISSPSLLPSLLFNSLLSLKMVHFSTALELVLSTASILVSASHMPTAAPNLKDAAVLNKRASCTFTDASAASRSKAYCATIVLDNTAVPSGTTLDLTDLTAGTYPYSRSTSPFTDCFMSREIWELLARQS